jgi:hypothetical protein
MQRYANRAKNIKNKPKINEDPKDALLREFQEEIARLKAALAGKDGGVSKKRSKKAPRTGPDGRFKIFKFYSVKCFRCIGFAMFGVVLLGFVSVTDLSWNTAPLDV